MAASKIGPQELFLYSEHQAACEKSLKVNNETSIIWFRDYQKITEQFKKTFSVKNGDQASSNILMLTCQYKNWTLLKFLLDDIQDKDLINIEDSYGKTALSMLFITRIGSEKEIEFAKLLIAKGAKVDVPLLNRPKLTQCDVDGYHYPDTIAGALLQQWANLIRDKQVKTSTKLYEEAVSLFLEHDSKIKAPIIGRMSLDRIEEEGNPIVTICTKLFIPLKVNALWQKARMLFLAKKSANSPFYKYIHDDCLNKLVSTLLQL